MGEGVELANWIYWEENNNYYCSECLDKRLDEVNKNREFSGNIDYENGETCGYYQDYAYSGDDENPEQEHCCKCFNPLFTIGVD